MTQINNKTYIKAQAGLIKQACNEIESIHYDSLTPDVDALIRSITFAAEEIEMTLTGKNYVPEPTEPRERN